MRFTPISIQRKICEPNRVREAKIGMNENVYQIPVDGPRIRSVMPNGKVRLSLPDAIGHCYNEYVELESGLGLGYLHYHSNVPLIEETSGPHAQRVVVITIGLQGRSTYEGQDGVRLEFSADHITISSFYPSHGKRIYTAGQTTSQLRVVAHESLIKKYLGQERTAEILGSDRLNHLAFRTITPEVMVHVKALLSYLTPCQSPLPRLDLHIHALGLLNAQLSALSQTPHHCASPFSPSEIERIKRAHQIMVEQLAQPITMNYLAATTGINKNKLREGMLYLYRATPADLLLQLRMRKAFTLLEAGLQISQVAWEVGYKFPNNFTVAFTRFYGQPPKKMFSKRNLISTQALEH